MIKVDGEDGQEAREQTEELAGGEMCGTCVLLTRSDVSNRYPGCLSVGQG